MELLLYREDVEKSDLAGEIRWFTQWLLLESSLSFGGRENRLLGWRRTSLFGTSRRRWVSGPPTTARFFGNLGSREKTLKIYDDFYHEALNELGKEDLLSENLAYVGSM